MKHAWILGLMGVLAVPASALAQGAVAGWCGGSYGAQGTNFAPCAGVEREVMVAGQGGGITRQTVVVPMEPEYPATMVTFEDGKAVFHAVSKDGQVVRQDLNLKWVPAADRSGAFQSPGDAGDAAPAP
jgi:hypothetical protein